VTETPDYLPQRSEEVDDILATTPAWTIRWGISLVFAVIILLLLGAYFIQYPDVIRGTVILTSEKPPLPIVASVGGKLTHLYVNDQEKVTQGQVLAVIENPARYEDVVRLKKRLERFSLENPLQSTELSGYHLGDIQGNYSLFAKALADYTNFLRVQTHQQKIASFREQIRLYQGYYEPVQSQENILQQEVDLAQNKYRVDSMLASKGSIAPFQLTESQSSLLQKKYSLQGARSSLAQIQLQMEVLQKNITETELDYQQNLLRLQTDLTKSYENVLNSIAEWEQHYILKAPLSGKIAFFSYWAPNQTVKAGEEVMSVSPDSSAQLRGKATLSLEGSGKIQVHQKVIIKLVNYPTEEYGMLQGEVSSISIVPKEGNLIVDIALPNGLQTTYHKQLEFKQQMQGVAEIVTRKRSILERIFNRFRGLFEGHV